VKYGRKNQEKCNKNTKNIDNLKVNTFENKLMNNSK
jgi:hypothetical protein